MNDSRIPGLYKLPVPERISALQELGWLSHAEAAELLAGRQILSIRGADHMIENVVGVFGLPFAIAPNFSVNGIDRLVPLVVEEPSIVAALSAAAALARRNGGFSASCDEFLLAGQIHISGAAAAEQSIDAAREELLSLADAVHPRLKARGGGVRDLECRSLTLQNGEPLLAVHVLVDTCDAMGANLVNTICEAIAPRIEEICGGQAALRILSNLTDRSVVRASVQFAADRLATNGMSGAQVRDAIVLANDIAVADPHRAATHNKGIMNGIDPLAVATGNDWRAIEAGAHAYAARDGAYRALTDWSTGEDGSLVGAIEIPLKPGIVGGTLASNRAAALGLALTGVSTARELAELMAAVGLAQNFAAIRALATSGIQRGHMRLHARSLAAAAGADGAKIDSVVEQLVATGEVKDWKAREIVLQSQVEELSSDAETAAGKLILFGEHAAVYGRHALALPIPGAVRAVARLANQTRFRVHEWGLVEAETSAMVNVILDGLQCRDQCFEIDVHSKLPPGKGLGSSAAVAVAATRAIAAAASLTVDDTQVNEIAFASEKIMHGTPSGVDNTVACYARPILFRRSSVDTSEINDLAVDPSLPLVVAVAHGTGATDAMVAGVRERRDNQPEAYERVFDQIDEISKAGAAALESSDYRRLGQLMNVCQGLLNAIGVSSAELEHMLEIARANGAIGAKLTGAGGGGAIVALCPGTTDQVRSALDAAGYGVLNLLEQNT